MDLFKVLDWFAGGSGPDRYHTLWDCMAHDTLWVTITVLLDLTVAAGYGLIALHWWHNQRSLHNHPARIALGRMRNIFLFCGICGYIFIPIKMVWPAWRLYDIFMLVLAYTTWRYAWGARDLRVVYTELSRSEQLAKDLAATREESRRKSQFLSSISHDLRNPLFGSSLFVEVAERSVRAGNQAQAEHALSEVRKGLSQASALLTEFLELSRLDGDQAVARIETFDVRDVVLRAALLAQPTAEAKGIELKVDAPVVQMRSDPAKLHRIVGNLLSNAVKYTHAGHVSVRVERREQSEASPRVAIHVEDTGIGIAPEHLDRIFDDFYQVDNHERDGSKGFGLGLAITRRLVLSLQGDISVRSTPGRGSTFTVVIPDSAASAVRAAAGAGVPAGVG
jgi:signal transduction histidine kinase